MMHRLFGFAKFSGYFSFKTENVGSFGVERDLQFSQ